jgi:hypothetical protein
MADIISCPSSNLSAMYAEKSGVYSPANTDEHISRTKRPPITVCNDFRIGYTPVGGLKNKTFSKKGLIEMHLLFGTKILILYKAR